MDTNTVLEGLADSVNMLEESLHEAGQILKTLSESDQEVLRDIFLMAETATGKFRKVAKASGFVVHYGGKGESKSAKWQKMAKERPVKAKVAPVEEVIPGEPTMEEALAILEKARLAEQTA